MDTSRLNALKAQHDPLLWRQMRDAYVADNRLPDPEANTGGFFSGLFSKAFGASPVNETSIAKTAPMEGGTPTFGASTPDDLERRRDWFNRTGGQMTREPTEVPPAPVRNPSRDYQAMHNLGRAGALRSVMGGYIDKVNKNSGLDDDTAETLLHNFADSATGREFTDVFVRGMRDAPMEAKAREEYKKYVDSWQGQDEPSMKSINVPRPMPVKAALMKNEKDVAKVVRAVEKRPAIITDASDYGFSSDRVVIVKGKEPVKDPEAILSSPQTPVVSQRGFVDIMRYLRPNG